MQFIQLLKAIVSQLSKFFYFFLEVFQLRKQISILNFKSLNHHSNNSYFCQFPYSCLNAHIPTQGHLSQYALDIDRKHGSILVVQPGSHRLLSVHKDNRRDNKL
jgi:hypothetical protein